MKHLILILSVLLLASSVYAQYISPPRQYLVTRYYDNAIDTSDWKTFDGTKSWYAHFYASDSCNVTIKYQLSIDSAMASTQSASWVSRWLVGDSTNMAVATGSWKSYSMPRDSLAAANRIRFIVTKKTTKNGTDSLNQRYTIFIQPKAD